MAGGAIIGTGEVKNYEAKFTAFVIATCFISATGGLIFGYDIGISGGVTSMDMFLSRFFPRVLQKSKGAQSTNYCKFDSPPLTLFTSSLYLAALIASFFASTVTRVMGRRISMLCGGLIFLAGAAINGAAQNIAMLIIGRILLGIGIGFTNQSIPVYLSEVAPPKYRGGFNMCFQLFITIGIMMANLINYGTQNLAGWGWRLSLALAAVPALIITVGSLFLKETPNSLIERGQTERAKNMLKRIRGKDVDIEPEFNDLVAASDASKLVRHPWRNILQRRYRAQLVMAICIPFFQQMTGINVIMFYAPVLFKTIGFGSSASLLSAVITGSVNVVATLMSIATVDRVGRRALFIEGGIQMLISQGIIAAIFAVKFGTNGQGSLSADMANLVVALICIYVAGFAWSWGPLGWLVPSEIFPLEIRSAGQSINVSVNMLFTFAVAQLFLLALCHLKYGLFLFFSVFVVIMTAFIYFLLPETKNVPIEEMTLVWQKHWFWGRFFDEAQDDNPRNLNKTVEHLDP